jgi:hypothetical protein
MTILFWYFGGMVTALVVNYVIHQPNKEQEDNLYRNTHHNYDD